jgi:stage II sporulation protein R
MAISLVAGLFPVHGESEIYDTVVRLHVIANSDSEEDQELKLKVRDRILEVVGPAVKDCGTQAEAIAAIGEIREEIEDAAMEVIEREGFDYSVSVAVKNEYYPTKTYESCAFPEGEYVSLQIKIGKSEGENWWCCLFPPLCLSASSGDGKDENEEAFISVGLTDDQYKVITETSKPKYKARFKILETFSRWFGK